MKNQEKSYQYKLEQEALRIAAYFHTLALHEGNLKGRLQRLNSIAQRAAERADRRFKASLGI
jgi:endo-1,4-beta-D-glucanase Y